MPALLFQLFGAFKNKSNSELQQRHWYHLLSVPGSGTQHNWLFWYFWAEILLLPRSDVHTGPLTCLHSYPSISMAGCPLKQGAEPISTRQHASPILAQTGTEASDTACPQRSFLVDGAAKEDLVFHSRELWPWQSLITVRVFTLCSLLLEKKVVLLELVNSGFFF